MSWQIIKRLNEERGEALAAMKGILKLAEDEKRDGKARDLTPEENTQFDALNTKAEQRKLDIEKYERTAALEVELAKQGKGEQRAGRDDLNTPEQAVVQKAKEQRAAFDKYLRFGAKDLAPDETRALTISGAGGVVGDRPFYDQLVLGMKAYAGVRQAGATILPTSDGNSLTVPSLDDTSNTGILVGEAADSESENDPTPNTITLNAFKFDSTWIKLSLELIQDAAYPVEATILSMASERIGRALNTYTTNGTGSGQPEGFVPAAGVGKVAALTSAISYEEIIDFVHSLDAAYRNTGKAIVQMHDTTLAAIRKLKNGNGQYIWQAGAAGAPANILDFNYVVNNDMAQLTSGAGSTVMAFGDFSRYFIRDVAAPYIVQARELFISDGLIGYKVFSRHDGNLADSRAVKLLKLAAS